MTKISLVQQGIIEQNEFFKFLMMGSRGRLEVSPALTDDERRDCEIHMRGEYGFGLAGQMKSTMSLRRYGGHAQYIRIEFPVRATRVVNNPLYWYFLGYLDPKLMQLDDPLFVIPSKEFHKHAAPRRQGAFWWYTFVASMEAKTRDQWHPWRVNKLELGERVMEIMAELRKRHDIRHQWEDLARLRGLPIRKAS